MSTKPTMRYTPDKTVEQMVQFGGLRYGQGGRDGEFAQTGNLSARLFPALSQRLGREAVGEYPQATALYARGGLLLVNGSDLVYDGNVVGQVTPGEKEMVSVNTKIVLFPDKVYFDTTTASFGSLEATVTAPAGQVTWTENTLKLTGQGDLTTLFAVGQGVEISGSSIAGNNKTSVLRQVAADTLTFASNAFTKGTEKNAVTVARRVPDLSCVCESGNRLWGAEGATIWASALGDPLTFHNYEGLSTDAFAVAVGTDGAFTGCAAYGSNVLFFKENALHKVLGSMPSEYRVYDYAVPGVQQGSHKSLTVINEVLFYKGTEGVYAYNGATPSLVSASLAPKRFSKAVGGSDGSRYYLSMEETGGGWGLFVYDPTYEIWLREDDTHVVDFAAAGASLYFLDGKGGGVYQMGREEGAEEIEWEALFYPFEELAYGKRGYSRLWMKCILAPDAWVRAEVREDGGPFYQAGVWSGEGQRSVTGHILPGRCNSFQLRLSGRGRCVVQTLVREFDVGRER